MACMPSGKEIYKVLTIEHAERVKGNYGCTNLANFKSNCITDNEKETLSFSEAKGETLKQIGMSTSVRMNISDPPDQVISCHLEKLRVC